MRKVELGELPGTSALFRAYARGKPEALALYAHDPFDPNSLVRQAEAVAARDYDRKRLAEVLAEQNRGWGADRKALDNCRRLGLEESLAVVTGQQVGLLGGPLFSLIKALHTVRLAEQYERELRRPVVPLFWMELEDHDLDEVNQVTVKDEKHRLHTLRLNLEGDGNRRPVKDIALGADVERLLARLEENLPRTGFSKALVLLLRECYLPEDSFAGGFARLYARLLSRFGLVLADPSHSHFKRRVAAVFAGEIGEPGAARPAFAAWGDRIAALGFSNQVAARAGSLQLFLLVDGEKYRLATANEGFKLVGSDVRFSRGELLELAEGSPERFVPAVLLRPLVQDKLFPTAAYVGGPSEVSYLAQITPLYREFGIPMPMIVPRCGITLVGSAARRIIDKYEIDFQEIYQPPEELVSHVMAEHIPSHSKLLFQQARSEILGALERLGKELDGGDEGFYRVSKSVSARVEYQLGKLEKKYFRAQERTDELLVRQLRRLSNSLYPNGTLQERVLPAIQFINLYGPDIVTVIYESIEPSNPVHCYIDI